MSDKESGPGGGVGLAVDCLFCADGLTTESERTQGVVMNLNKLARWASVTAFSVIVPAAALAKTHHSRLTHPTTAPSSLISKHTKAIGSKKILASKLKAHSIKAKALKTTKHKQVLLKSKKSTGRKLMAKKHVISRLTARKHVVSKLTAKKHVASKLRTTKTRAHMLTTRKATAKTASKRVTPVTPTM
jgi:hypothetical protein